MVPQPARDLSIIDLIRKKRDGHELTNEQIRQFVDGVVSGNTPAYQTAAFLMAVYVRGMTACETASLTFAMRDSGDVLNLAGLGRTVDKHSTGGVGDNATLVVVPILAAAGVPVLKMSGRALGFSGGTIDKLHAIPGFNTGLTVAEAIAQTRKVGAALIAQSEELVPADAILYALRDATGTVESMALIASSIMSKKLAAGASRILLDVKVGGGAFMKSREQAEDLARLMVNIGRSAGVPTSALLTSMDEPLGGAVGNSLEVKEAIMVLTKPGAAEPRLLELCLALATHGLVAGGKAKTASGGRVVAERLLVNGAAAAAFAAIVEAQGGPVGLDALARSLPSAPVVRKVTSRVSGVVRSIDAERVGRLVMKLGGGRHTLGEKVNPAVGVTLSSKVGSRVVTGRRIATVHARNRVDADWAASDLESAYGIDATPPARIDPGPVVLAEIGP